MSVIPKIEPISEFIEDYKNVEFFRWYIVLMEKKKIKAELTWYNLN